MFFYANKEHGLGAVQVVKSLKLNPVRQAGAGAGRGQEEIALQHIGLKAVCPMTGPQMFLIKYLPQGQDWDSFIS